MGEHWLQAKGYLLQSLSKKQENKCKAKHSCLHLRLLYGVFNMDGDGYVRHWNFLLYEIFFIIGTRALKFGMSTLLHMPSKTLNG